MCRHLAYVGPPVTLADVVLSQPHSLLRQSWEPRYQTHSVVNADGFGVGWYASDIRAEPARYRSERPMWTDRSFASFAGVVRTHALLAAVRSASPGLPVEESGSAPFTAGRWLFSHNGVVEGGQHRIRPLLSDTRAAAIEGATDSEALFAFVLDQLDDGADAATALTNAVRAGRKIDPAGRINLLLTDGAVIAATAAGNSLFTLERDGAVVVASEPYDDDLPWSPVPDGSVVAATPEAITIGALPPAFPGHAGRH